jgi:hypothetical protein
VIANRDIKFVNNNIIGHNSGNPIASFARSFVLTASI